MSCTSCQTKHWESFYIHYSGQTSAISSYQSAWLVAWTTIVCWLRLPSRGQIQLCTALSNTIHHREKKKPQKNYNCLFWKGKKNCVEISFFLLLPVDSKLRSQIPFILPYIWNIIYRMTTLIYDFRLWWWSLPFWNAKI